ncbi:MAG: PadR family transcriptional regulator [Anaerolineae bacterium]
MQVDETLLGLLAAQPMHGYQLLEAFQDPHQLGRVWKLSTSQLYSVLKRLERSGDISGAEQPSEIGPPRIAYTLTAQGRARVQAWLDEPSPSASIRRVRVEFLSRLWIAQRLRLPTAPIIARQRAACQTEFDRLQQERAAPHALMERLTLDLVQSQLRAALEWLDRCEVQLVATSHLVQGDTL